MFENHGCPELLKVDALATYDGDADPDTAMLEHLGQCAECRLALQEHQQLDELLFSLPLNAFVRWYSVPMRHTDNVLCVLDAAEEDVSFEVFDSEVDLANHLAARFDDRLVVYDPELRELAVDEIGRRAAAPDLSARGYPDASSGPVHLVWSHVRWHYAIGYSCRGWLSFGLE